MDILYIIYSLYNNIFIHILYLIYLVYYIYIHLFVTISEWLTVLDVLVKLSCFTIHMTNSVKDLDLIHGHHIIYATNDICATINTKNYI